MTLVIAHRGASASHPQNTLEAFRAAAAQGADWVELDVRLTADGTLAIHHDPHLPDGREIFELTRSELPESVPALAESLEACAGMGINIEIKNEPAERGFDPTRSLAAPTLEVALAICEPESLLVSSFDFEMVGAVRALDVPVKTAMLYSDPTPTDELIRVALDGGHSALNSHDPLVDAAFVEAVHDAGLAVNVWTVDDPARITELVAMGVDGIVTNNPAATRKLVPSA
ncbi:MAG: glycerophosphodiester phosphodiesterase [Acidimicrobiales bacterium]